MEQISKQHKLTLTDGDGGTVTGITKAISFDDDEIILHTYRGRLVIHGTELHVSDLSIEKGEMTFTGEVTSIAYSEIRTVGRAMTGLLGRMFK